MVSSVPAAAICFSYAAIFLLTGSVGSNASYCSLVESTPRSYPMIRPTSGSWTMKSMKVATSAGCLVRALPLSISEPRYWPVFLPSAVGMGAMAYELLPSAE